MARMHMLKNKQIVRSNARTGERSPRFRIICAVIAVAMVLLSIFTVISTVEILTGKRSGSDGMPFWISKPMRWSEDMTAHMDSIYEEYFGVDYDARKDPPPDLVYSISVLLLFLGSKAVLLVPFVAAFLIFCFSMLFVLGALGGGKQSEATSPGMGSVQRAGKEGERIAMTELMRLPNDYHVFGNLQFEYRNDRGELRPGEADFLVVGPTGLHLVEVKNWTGSISGCADHGLVAHTKTNGQIIQEKSPFFQAKANGAHLGQLVRKETGIRVFITANVFFTDDSLDIDMCVPSDCTAYKGSEQLKHRRLTQDITGYSGSCLNPREVDRIASAIEDRIWKQSFSEEALRNMRDS